MTDNGDIISNVVQWKSEGTESVIRDMDAVKDANAQATAAINDANTAVGNLNTGLRDVDFAPLQQGAADFWKPVEDASKKAGEKIKDTGDAMGAMGEAGQQLKGALDQLVPGLGGIFESITAINPMAIAGTVALTAVAAVFGDIEQKAQDARAAMEAASKAEADRAVAQLEVDQKLNLALSGNASARDSLIKDYAAVIDEREKLSVRETDLIRQRNEAQTAYDAALADAQEKAAGMGAAGIGYIEGAVRSSRDALDVAQKNLDALQAVGGEVEKNSQQMQSLIEATNQLGISEAELNAVRLAGTQGIDGATAALDAMKENAANAKEALTGLKDTVVKTAQDFAEASRKALEEQQKKAAAERERAEKSLIETNQKLTQVESDRGKALADRLVEAGREKEMGVLQDRLAAAQAYDAQVAKNQKIKELEAQGNAANIAAQQKHMADQQKLLAGYLNAEKIATEDYSRARVRRLEDLYNTLSGLAAQRDVAGYVNARASGLTGIGREDADAGLASSRRRDAFDSQSKELEAAFAKENATRQAQLNQQLQQQQNAGQQQLRQADIVNRQIADLRARYAEQDLQARRREEDASYRQTVTILQQKRMDELKITAGAAAGVINFISQIRDAATRLGSGFSQAAARSDSIVPNSGSPYVRPTTGRQLNVNVQSVNVGQVATPQDINNAVNGLVRGIANFAGVPL